MPARGETKEYQGYLYTFDGVRWVRSDQTSSPQAPQLRQQTAVAEQTEAGLPYVGRAAAADVGLTQAQIERTETQTQLDLQKMEETRRQGCRRVSFQIRGTR